MRLARRSGPGAAISLTPLVDVMLILLVFFMVTSTYLDLDMIPTAPRSDEAAAEGGSAGPGPRTFLVRLDAQGHLRWRGSTFSAPALAEEAAKAADEGPVRLLVLPSGGATAQALVSLLDATAGLRGVETRVLRLEGTP